jgi:hypothetical protein
MALHPLFQRICAAFGAPPPRPPEPDHQVWYRGWECGYDADAAYWGAEPWIAYKGGCDLDVPQTSGRDWNDLLNEIDAEEGE